MSPLKPLADGRQELEAGSREMSRGVRTGLFVVLFPPLNTGGRFIVSMEFFLWSSHDAVECESSSHKPQLLSRTLPTDHVCLKSQS